MVILGLLNIHFQRHYVGILSMLLSRSAMALQAVIYLEVFDRTFHLRIPVASDY